MSSDMDAAEALQFEFRLLHVLLDLRGRAEGGDAKSVRDIVNICPKFAADAAVSLARKGITFELPACTDEKDRSFSSCTDESRTEECDRSALIAACEGGHEALALRLCPKVVDSFERNALTQRTLMVHYASMYAAARTGLYHVVNALESSLLSRMLPSVVAQHKSTALHDFDSAAAAAVAAVGLRGKPCEPFLSSAVATNAAKFRDARALVWFSQRGMIFFDDPTVIVGALAGASRRILRRVLLCYESAEFKRFFPSLAEMAEAAVKSGHMRSLRAMVRLANAQERAGVRRRTLTDIAKCACTVGSLQLLARVLGLGAALPDSAITDVTNVTHMIARNASTGGVATASVRDAAALVEYLLLRSNIRTFRRLAFEHTVARPCVGRALAHSVVLRLRGISQSNQRGVPSSGVS